MWVGRYSVYFLTSTSVIFQGGSKLLLIGPWTKVSSTYTCVIDGEPVQTTLLQPGVLRCYTPGQLHVVMLEFKQKA